MSEQGQEGQGSGGEGRSPLEGVREGKGAQDETEEGRRGEELQGAEKEVEAFRESGIKGGAEDREGPRVGQTQKRGFFLVPVPLILNK